MGQVTADRQRHKAVVFDLDGTLIDSAPDIAAAVNKVVGKLADRSLSVAYVESFIGDGSRSMLRRIFADNSIEADPQFLETQLAAYLQHYHAEPVVRTRFYPHVKEDLLTLQAAGFQLGVCTNKPHELTKLVLQELGIASLFDAVCGADAVDHRKPHPEHLLAVVRQLGLAPEEILYVGDTEIDRACAHDADIAFFIVNWGGGLRMADGADTRIGRLSDLLAYGQVPEVSRR
ncbi:MAG: HAD-IA family hydrolase [Kiloniellales bacterium]